MVLFSRLTCSMVLLGALTVLGSSCAGLSKGSVAASESQEQVDAAAQRVKAALVRIKVVEPSFYQGREDKTVSFGSGSIISPDGYVVTNHHVAGKAINLVCTLPNREEVPAILIGTDPATDIAIIKLTPEKPTVWPFVSFGDSSKVRVGDPVLALGSPVALSQSVTLGIVSNTEMIMPPSYGDSAFTLDGENVGELVRWIGHDAAIYPGNSGGPLVNLEGEIVGVNEIGMGLGGAIPGNLAKSIAEELIANGRIRRAYVGFGLQPTLRHGDRREGVLINTILKGSPAEKAEIKPGDLLLSVNGKSVEGRFAEDLPTINQLLATLEIGKPAALKVLRSGEEKVIELTPEEREPGFIPEHEVREWGMSAADLNIWAALSMARDTKTGVLVTAFRAGGPLAKAKPELRAGDVIIELDGKPVTGVKELQSFTDTTLGEDKEKSVPVLVKFERGGEQLLSVVEIGIEKLTDPDREVVRGWFPMETQVLTRELATKLDLGKTTGVRVTRLYDQHPEGFPFQVCDIITEMDGEVLPAARKEDADLFRTALRQYRPGKKVAFTVLRNGEKVSFEAEILPSPAQAREMRRYRDNDFEFIVREAAWQDLEKPTLGGEKFSVMVDNVVHGGWADLGGLLVGDVLLQVNGEPIGSLDDVQRLLTAAREQKAKSVVLYVRRDVRNLFIELEPSWD
ncbi:PDZ domain-containing protein [bacterium]|nr:PDZ domain-containing protein [bacterium]